MAIIDEDGVSALLKSGGYKNIWCIFGNDSYLKEFYLNKLISAVVDENMRFFNFHTYEDRDTELDDIFADAENLPVMSEKTCLLIKNYPLNALGSEQLKDFEKKLSEVPETTVMIFYFGRNDVVYDNKTSSKWYNIINIFSKYGVAAEISHRTRAKTVKMLVKGAASRGTSIGAQEAEYLIDLVGEDIQTLLNEFNKVCAFSDGSPVTREMIDETAVKSIEASVFDISSAVFDGNADRAFETANELLRQKNPVQSILGALIGAYVNIYRLKTAQSCGKTADDFAEAFGYNKNTYRYVFRNVSSFASKTDPEKILSALDVLTDADTRSKSSSVDDGTLLTQTIAELAALAR